MLITFELSLFGEIYTESDAEFFPTLDTDITARCDFLPPVSLLLPAMFLGECRGLPLEEFLVSDGERAATVLRSRKKYLLPVNTIPISYHSIELTDAGVDITPFSCRVFNTDFLILRCDDLSLFDKGLAPRLITKAARDAFIAYEKRGSAVEFFACSHSIKKGLLPTAALILHSLLGARNLSSQSSSFNIEYYNGKPHLSVKA